MRCNCGYPPKDTDQCDCTRHLQGPRAHLLMPSPSKELIASPVFTALWELMKSWDVNVPEYYEGYCGVNGSHIKLIIDAISESEPWHIVEMTAHDFTLQHPISERLNGTLFECELHKHISSHPGPPKLPGTYKVTGEPENWAWEKIDE